MTMSGTVRVLLSFLVAIVTVYILEITTGPNMDSLYIQFYSLFAFGHLPETIWYYRTFIICLLAIGFWVLSTIAVEIDYSRKPKEVTTE